RLRRGGSLRLSLDELGHRLPGYEPHREHDCGQPGRHPDRDQRLRRGHRGARGRLRRGPPERLRQQLVQLRRPADAPHHADLRPRHRRQDGGRTVCEAPHSELLPGRPRGAERLRGRRPLLHVRVRLPARRLAQLRDHHRVSAMATLSPHRFALLAVAALALAACTESPAPPREGQATPRVVALGGAVAETVYALGADSLLVARDDSGVYPEALMTKPSVGYFRQIGAEGVLSTHPTLILADPNAGPGAVLNQIEAA